MNSLRYITNELCKEAINKHFPEIKIKTIKRNDEGWDNYVFIINNELVFRFPRRHFVLRDLKLEINLLKKLGKEINIPIPQFDYVSNFTNEEELFVGYKLIKGIPFTPSILDNIQSKDIKKGIAVQIADFLSSLHGFPIQNALNLGVPNHIKRVNIENLYLEIQQKIFSLISQQETKWTNHLFSSFLDNKQNFTYNPVLLHGDFFSDHILFDKKLEKIGIIDFTDVRIGDPARDFSWLVDYDKNFGKWIFENYKGTINSTFYQRRKFYYSIIPFYMILGGIHLEKQKSLSKGLQMLKKASKDRLFFQI